MKYAIIDNVTKAVSNVIIWDGVSEWTPPVGTSVKCVEGVQCGIGWVELSDGTFIDQTTTE